MTLEYDELVRYTNEEREKWRAWFTAHPDAMEVEVQPGGRFGVGQRTHRERGSREFDGAPRRPDCVVDPAGREERPCE